MTTEEAKDRLRRARIAAGFPSAAEAARRFCWRYSSYAAHENGQNGIDVEHATLYGKAFDVAASYILTGDSSNKKGFVSVPIVGRVGAGFMVTPFELSEQKDTEGDVRVPSGLGNRLCALKVVGNSMVPAYYDGDIIFYEHDTSSCPPPKELIGKECVIRTTDGKMHVKRLQKGSRHDRFLLVSYNSEPILDAKIEWACRVIYIKRA